MTLETIVDYISSIWSVAFNWLSHMQIPIIAGLNISLLEILIGAVTITFGIILIRAWVNS